MTTINKFQILMTGLGALLLSAACSSESIGPCEGDNPAAECEQSCETDGCAFGFYCGQDGQCTADCDATAVTEGCEDGFQCNSSGQCQEVIEMEPEDCPDVTVALSPITPTVVLLVDQSGSMNSNLQAGGPSRWDAVKTALLDPTDGVVTQLIDRVDFGASLYSSTGGDAGGVCPIINETLPTTGDNYQDIVDLFEANSPNRDTPTAESIDAATANFVGAEGPKVIVLATDGNPDRCDDANAHDAVSQALSETAVQNAFSSNISTFVLSVGDQVAETHLQRLANAGLGLDLDTGLADFYVATDSTLLASAFDSIIRGVRTCEATLDSEVDLSRADEGTVTLNGVELVAGSEWQLKDQTTIELLGAACDTFLNEDSVVLEASFPCGIVVQ